MSDEKDLVWRWILLDSHSGERRRQTNQNQNRDNRSRQRAKSQNQAEQKGILDSLS
jgi:hypothetical protein